MSGPRVDVLEAQRLVGAGEVGRRMQRHQARVQALLAKYPQPGGALLMVLWLVQEEFGWVPREAIRWAAETCQVSPVRAFGVVGFYTMYRQTPPGRHVIQVCHGPCCTLKGAEALIRHLEKRLGVAAGGTSVDGEFTLLRVECLAACGNAPAVQIDDEQLLGPDGFNQCRPGWGPTPAALDALLDRLRGQPTLPADALGDPPAACRGAPGAVGATATPLSKDYAPAPPAIQVAAQRGEAGTTVTCLCAPESTRAVLERSDDGLAWRTVADLDIAKAPALPGPPGGPKPVTLLDAQPGGRHRVLVHSGARAARPSEVPP